MCQIACSGIHAAGSIDAGACELCRTRARTRSIRWLEKELNETKERQRKTLDDLTQAVKLNAALQERIVGVSQALEPEAEPASVTPQDQQKASELKRKIEVILEPQKDE